MTLLREILSEFLSPSTLAELVTMVTLGFVVATWIEWVTP